MSVADTIQSLGLLGPGSVVELGRNPDSAKYPTVVPSDMLPQGAQRIVIPQTGSGTGTGPGGFSPTGMLPSGMSAAEFSAALDRMQGSGQFDDGDPDSHSEPLDPVSSTGFNFADAIFTGLGLLNPAFRALSLPFTLARGYNALFGEDDDVDTTALDAWGIDPLGTLGGLGGPPGLDDTTEVTGPPTATQAAISMANTEALTDPASASGDGAPAGGVSGDPGAGVGEDSEAVGDPDSDSGDDPGGSGDPGGGGGDDGSGDPGDGDDDYALGGLLSGSGPKDITAHGGEYVIRKSAVDKYGTDLFDMLNKGLLSV
jgi:hypothetical protein